MFPCLYSAYSILYIFSDLLSPFLYYVIRYRRRVVRNNLKESFPEKDDNEIKSIEKKFYKHLADMFIEYLVLLKLDAKKMDKRLKYKNCELLEELYTKGKDVILIMGHYGNWEFFTHTGTKTKYIFSPIYKHQSNEYFNFLIYKVRCKYGAELIEMKNAFSYIRANQQNNIRTILVLLTDQSPVTTRYFVDFLNHKDTPVVEGVERIGKALDMAILFGDVKKTSRGHYEMEFVSLYENPKETKQGEITESHVRYLENKIQAQPEYWLWSHRRWKRTKEDFAKVR